MQAVEEVMPTLALCHVVRTSVLLGPERITQALKIILTSVMF
jgi:hypothetical protein